MGMESVWLIIDACQNNNTLRINIHSTKVLNIVLGVSIDSKKSSHLQNKI